MPRTPNCWAFAKAAGLAPNAFYLPSGKVVEFTCSLYRGDAYDFAVELKLAPDGERNLK